MCVSTHTHTHPTPQPVQKEEIAKNWKQEQKQIYRGSPKASYLAGTPWVPTASPSSRATSDKMESEKGPNCLQTHLKAEKDIAYF